ncbi:MAG: hypothetical protein KBC78_01765, partial [Candidatus Pacebacteria bacterium]|nr:hypothetical protein [Candidatus Paceibacterota bacterium]
EKLNFYKQEKVISDVASTTNDYYRVFDNAYLALPEWYIVYSADEYTVTLRDGLPTDFSYFGAIKDYWRQHDEVLNLTKDSVNNNEDYLTVLSVIGWSFTVENIIKGIYENSIGRFTEWLAGDTQVAEDIYAYKVANDYATFIYDYPWYDFSYSSALIGVWTLDNEKDYTWLQDVRRLERKLILTVEYGIKATYSSVIAFATHTKFGVQDDVIYAVVTRDDGKNYELIKAPHYHPFTRLLLSKLEEESNNKDFRIINISGNNKITFTYRDQAGAVAVDGTKEILRDAEIVSIKNNEPEYLDRITVETEVKDIAGVYRRLQEKNISIDHFYDY